MSTAGPPQGAQHRSAQREGIAMNTERFQGVDAVRLRGPDGASAWVTPHGAHVVSWQAAGDGAERLYLSPNSAYGAGQAIRGGVPLVFPQFSNRGPLPKHGFARNLVWQLTAHEGGSASFVLRDDARTRAVWPHGFTLGYRVAIQGQGIEMALSCSNTGDDAYTFMAALHTYLRVDDIDRTRVEGLEGLPWFDAVDGQKKPAVQQALRPQGEVDRVYGPVPSALRICESRLDDGADTRLLHVAQQGFQDVVVWNPGPAKAASLGDMPPKDYPHMLCVESARIHEPVRLEPGQDWTGVQRLRVEQC